MVSSSTLPALYKIRSATVCILPDSERGKDLFILLVALHGCRGRAAKMHEADES